MRVTGGLWRSRRLKGPGRGRQVRPTPDAMRERAFAVLGERVVGARVLDLFAGTGAVGIEALSRGAATVVFVERHRPTARLLLDNLASFEVASDRAVVRVEAALTALRRLARTGGGFDLAWADPPFEHWTDGLAALREVVRAGLITTGGTLCLECPSRADLGEVLDPVWEVERDLAGGASRVVVLRAR